MGLDVRLPIGGMFAAAGLLLVIYGAMTGGDTGLYARSLDININLWWGAVMLIFGLLMLFFARRSRSSEGVHLTSDSSEGRATEIREHQLGLEKD